MSRFQLDRRAILGGIGGMALALPALDAMGAEVENEIPKRFCALYTANGMNTKGRDGAQYPNHAGLCLETQHFPDSINKPNFPSVILKPGQTYQETTVFRFSN